MSNDSVQGIDVSHYQGLAAYPLWIADYGVAEPTLPNGWTTWLLWQYSETGTVQGIDCPVDLDLLQGPIANLAALTLT